MGLAAQARLEGQPSCFFHAQSFAETPCDTCGRLLCAVCTIKVGEVTCCSNCLERAQNQGDPEALTQLFMHDKFNLLLAVGPLLLFPLALPFTAAYSLYSVFKHYRAPLGPVPRTRFRHAAAAAVALVELLALGLFAVYLLMEALDP